MLNTTDGLATAEGVLVTSAGARPYATGTIVRGGNDSGALVGMSFDDHGNGPAFQCDSFGRYTRPDVTGADSAQATGINDAGQVVGCYREANGAYGFLASPVPEPATWPLVGTGLLALVRRRRWIGRLQKPVLQEARSIRARLPTLLAATTLAVTGLAQANIVTNGGFETGDFNGWTQFGDVSASGVDSGSPFAHTGNFGAFFGPERQGGIFQTLATTAGATYHVSFFASQLFASTNTFEFNWDGGAAEWSYANINPGFTTLNFDLIATTNSTDLRFTFSNPPSSWAFDDVSVEARAVPEPASLALVGLGIAGLMVTRRQRVGKATTRA